MYLRTPSIPSPANLYVESTTESSVSLAWDPVDGIGTYKIYREPGGMIFPASGNSYTDNSITTGTTYTYHVTCIDATFGEGPASITVTATPAFQTTPGTAPNLVVNSTASTNINLKWDAVAKATGYRVYRDTTAGGPFTTKVYDGPNAHYTDRGLAGLTSYYYKAYAYNGVGEGPYSTEATGKTLTDVFSSVDFNTVKDLTYSLTQLKGGNAVNDLPVGRLVYYKTTDGRYGVFEVQQLDPAINNDLMIRWNTWNAGGGWYSGGEGLVIHGTWMCDLDLGAETVSIPPADFQWNIVTSSERYIEAISGAGFYLP